MTTLTEAGPENRFVRAVLPWLVAAVGLMVYLSTLNHWISIGSVPYTARITGQNWVPELTGPYALLGPFAPPLYLVTYPFRWLPAKWVPLALNLFSAVCSAALLGLLARSVALLPHDRTHEQRQRERGPFALLSLRTAWIPPLLAVILCGLQLSFWQTATAMSGDVFNLLLLAYIVRCLLEYRIDPRDSWLLRAAMVYGVAMTGDWLIVGLAPAFIVSVGRLKGLDFFKLRFLRGMLLCALAGLTLYLVLPLANTLKGIGDLTFGQALLINLNAQKGMLSLLFAGLPLHLLLLLAITSLLPLLLISIRWTPYFGDPSKIGIALTTSILHVAHAAFMLICVWVAFDPMFSPRQKGFPLPTLDYLGALSVGYFTGYFLLVFRPLLSRTQPPSRLRPALNAVSQATVWGLLLVVPVGLICKNFPQIRLTNGQPLKEYAALLTRNLPERALLLCDSESTRTDLPQRLWLAEAWLAHCGRATNYIFLDTSALPVSAYHRILQQRYANDWPVVSIPKNAKTLPAAALVSLVTKLSEQRPIYYLNSSFGYYFEFYYPQSHGLVFELKRYPTNSIGRPPLTAAEVEENENFWRETRPAIERLRPWARGSGTNRMHAWGPRLMRRLKIPFEPNATALTLCRYYSQLLNAWGVQMQQAGHLRAAAEHFDFALALHPDNIGAQENLECNEELQAGRHPGVPTIQALMERFAKYRDWQQVMRENGPFDDPLHCLGQAVAFSQGHLMREAALQFERIHFLDPENLTVCFWLARFYAGPAPDKTLALVSHIRARPERWEEFSIQKRDLTGVEAMALYRSRKAAEAERILQQAMEENPRDELLLAMVVQISASAGRLTNALTAIERELQITPTNTEALVLQGYFLMQNTNFAQAIPPLTRALSLQPNNFTARFDRAIAYLRSGQLDRAREDYGILEKAFPNSFRIHYGIAEIAWQRKDTNLAIRYYQLYLSNAIPDTEEARLVSDRLDSLTSRPP